MAGDWIKVRHDLFDDPAVITLSQTLHLDRCMIVGKLVRLWCWADAQTVNGKACVARGFVDELCGKNFAAALANVGWFRATETGFELPGFSKHNSQTAKRRALTATRVAKSRKRSCNAASVTKKRSCNARSVTKALPEKRREEKSREEKSNSELAASAAQLAEEGNVLFDPGTAKAKAGIAPNRFLAMFAETYAEAFGAKPGPLAGKDAGLGKAIARRAIDEADALARLRIAAGLNGTPPWPFDRPGGFTLASLSANWDRLAPELQVHKGGARTSARPLPGEVVTLPVYEPKPRKEAQP